MSSLKTGISGKRLKRFQLERRHAGHDQFASCVYYGTATVDDRDGRRRGHRLVLKYKLPTPEKRALYKSDKQFHNEKLFYERIAPFLLAHGSPRDGPAMPSLCRYVYGRNDCGDLVHRDVIVLENECVRGYRKAVADHPVCLDFDHLIVALGTLAKFHWLSYRAKHEDSAKFAETIAAVKETHWSENGEWILHSAVLRGLISVAVDKVNGRHVGCDDGGGGDNELGWMGRFQSELLTDVMQTMRRVAVPVKPQAVLCHGDFNRNNLLFLYDESGQPVDALAYDMATVRYGSPALDLSFFLYLNTDRQTRDDHWDELLDAYCATLAMDAGDVPVPSRDQLDAEMREHGFYGLTHTSYFLRTILDENQTTVGGIPGAENSSGELNRILSKGGDLATEWIADVIQHYVRCRYSSKTPIATDATTRHQ